MTWTNKILYSGNIAQKICMKFSYYIEQWFFGWQNFTIFEFFKEGKKKSLLNFFLSAKENAIFDKSINREIKNYSRY